mgnify:FL=1
MEIRKLRHWWQLNDFLALPGRIYRGNPCWVPVPRLWTWFSMGRLDEPGKAFYVVYRDGQPRARAGFKVHRVKDQEYLHFGFFEALPDSQPEVMALIERGHQLAPHLPMRGPYHFLQEDPFTGLLVKGFELKPTFFMSYNPPYYESLLEAAGLSKIMDLNSYQYTPQTARPQLMEGRARRAREKGITTEDLQGGKLVDKVRLIADIFNESLAENWGFEPIEGAQFQMFLLLARLVLLREGVLLARKDGEPIGCLIMLPNLNPVLESRYPWQALYRYWTRKKWIRSFRGYALGVRPAYRADEVAPALVEHLSRLGRQYGWDEVEVSWVVENNRPMNALALALGGQCGKVYRILERPPQ